MSLAAASARRHVRWQAMLLQSQLIAQRSILRRPALNRSQPFVTSLDRAHVHPMHGAPLLPPKPPISPSPPPPHAPLASQVALSSLQGHSPAARDIALFKSRRLSISAANVFPAALAGQAMPDRQALPASRQVAWRASTALASPTMAAFSPHCVCHSHCCPALSLLPHLITPKPPDVPNPRLPSLPLPHSRIPSVLPRIPSPYPPPAVRELKPVGKAAIGGPFTLVDGQGKPFTEADLKGRWALLYFGFTFCPDICPSELIKIAQAVDLVEKQVGVRVVPVFISVDPERDTAEQVKEYVKEFHPRMIGLTGTPEQVKAAARAFRVYYMKTEEEGYDYLVDHSIISYLMSPEFEFVKFFGRNHTPEGLADGIAGEIKGHGK
ncbi:unnamed protein product [Closterium sp. Yama58-4]|nr:unnamed protein product [Closterium sp. Yama58-4]